MRWGRNLYFIRESLFLTANFVAKQAVRKAEDDVAGVAKTVSDNYEDEDLRNSFTELVLQL